MKQKSEVFATGKIDLEVTRETIEDLFSAALDYSYYWCVKIRPITEDNSKKYVSQQMPDGFYAWEDEEENGKLKKHTVTTKKIKEAVELMAEKYPRHFRNAVLDDGVAMDAETGDVFLQLCVLGDIVYG